MSETSSAACTDSIRFPNFIEIVNYYTTDDTAFKFTFSYDSVACQGSTADPYLSTGADPPIATRCSLEPGSSFPDGEEANAVCSSFIRGDMQTDQPYELLVVINNEYFQPSGDFYVTHDPSPAPTSGAYQRRRLRLSRDMIAFQPSDIVFQAAPASYKICARGIDACPRSQGGWRCLNTQSSLYTCGGCPGTKASKDCSDIEGADDVACVAGSCEIKTCLQNYVLSSDGLWCVPEAHD